MSWQIFPVSQFEHHQAAWEELCHAGGHGGLLSLDFVLPLIDCFFTGNEILAVHVTSGTVDALAFLQKSKYGLWQTFQAAQSPFGLWLQHPNLSLEQLSASLVRTLPAFSLGLSITQQDPDIISRPLERGSLKTLDYIETARITVTGSFDDYWAQRGKNLRNNVKKQSSALAKEGVIARLDTLTHPEEMAVGLHDYAKLESAGWKAKLGTAITDNNAQGRFYVTMLKRFAAQGRARIYRYQFGDRVVAVDLCIQQGDQLVVLKTTYDESIKTFSPAMLMRYGYFKRLFDEGQIRQIEFYGGVMEWHRKLTQEIRTMYHINYYRWAFLSKLREWVSPIRKITNKNAHSKKDGKSTDAIAQGAE